MRGIDEVGRGAWAGPLCVAAVRLNDKLEGLGDSKVLSKISREQLSVTIHSIADVSIVFIDNKDIDANGLGWALKKAFIDAVNGLSPEKDELIIVDGKVNYIKELGLFSKAYIKADTKYDAVMAASIVAKVARDNYMIELSTNYPEYRFEEHVGYGTRRHIQAIKKNGISDVHRKSIKPLKNSRSK